MKPLALMVSLLAVAPAWAGQCSPQDVPQLLQQERSRVDSLNDCAHSSAVSASMGGLDGVCAASWKSLEQAEASSAPCMTPEQLEGFAALKHRYDSSCGEILEFKLDPNTPYENECRAGWDWLKPYEAKKAKDAQAKRDEELSTVEGVFKEERAREDALGECAKSSRTLIEMGGLDGACSINWSFLSPAEAKLGPGMSEQELQKFAALRAEYDGSCRKLTATLGAAAKSAALCGADWGWLAGAASARRLKAGQDRALGLIKTLP